MQPRPATEDDLADIVALHLQAWEETYSGLLPRSEFETRDKAQRLTIWGDILRNKMPVSYLPGVGFAHMGRHRNDTWRDAYPHELYSFYTLRHAHGSGAGEALLAHAIGRTFTPFTAEVLQGNDRATRFYEKIGGNRLAETIEVLGDTTCTNILFGYPVPIQLQN